MSYLHPLRLHFVGKFQANVSTVNNDLAHFNNATFKPSYQEMQGPNMNPPNGWFNPQGDAAFRLRGCRVTSAWMPDGTSAADSDAITQCLVDDSDSQVCAKLVDLDPQQQLVSMIWGLQVRITKTDGTTLLRGDFEPAAFTDMWNRATGSGEAGDMGFGAMYQSILTNLQWGDLSSSTFLQTLKMSSQQDGLLSIKFNVDGINMDFKSPDFMCGRVVGSIGPASAAEPHHIVLGRQFMTEDSRLNFFVARVDETTSSVFLDLGNTLSTASPGGSLNNVGNLTLGVYSSIPATSNPAGTVVPLGTIPALGRYGYASEPDWYSRTAGVVVLSLTSQQLELVQSAPLVLSTGNGTSLISEWTSGAFVRADQFVFRLSPGDRVQIAVFATQWGRPLSGAQVDFTFDDSGLQAGSSDPEVAKPPTALTFNGSAVTDQNGKAILEIVASDPQNPRKFIDGQVYGIRPVLSDAQFAGPMNPWNFVSFLVWDAFTPSEPVSWWGCLQPIFQQYANLYPVMQRFLDLSSYEQVCANIRLLELAFGLDPANPNSMPVTRDLSPAKRQAILRWFKNPELGTPPHRSIVVPTERDVSARTGAAEVQTPLIGRGGKTEAAAKRLMLTRKAQAS